MIGHMTHHAYLEMLATVDSLAAIMRHLNASDDAALAGWNATYGQVEHAVVAILMQAFTPSDAMTIQNTIAEDECRAHSAVRYIAETWMNEELHVRLLPSRYAV
jgi:hypothetical protein